MKAFRPAGLIKILDFLYLLININYYDWLELQPYDCSLFNNAAKS